MTSVTVTVYLSELNCSGIDSDQAMWILKITLNMIVYLLLKGEFIAGTSLDVTTRFYRSKRLQPRSGSMYTYFGLESASGLHFDPLLTNSASNLFDFSLAYCILLFVVKLIHSCRICLSCGSNCFFWMVCHEKNVFPKLFLYPVKWHCRSTAVQCLWQSFNHPTSWLVVDLLCKWLRLRVCLPLAHGLLSQCTAICCKTIFTISASIWIFLSVFLVTAQVSVLFSKLWVPVYSIIIILQKHKRGTVNEHWITSHHI